MARMSDSTAVPVSELVHLTVADQVAWARSTRPKACKLAMNRELAGIVTEKAPTPAAVSC